MSTGTPRATRMRLVPIVTLVLLAGCLAEAPAPDAPIEPVAEAEPSGPILAQTGCTATNGFGTVDEGALEPYVPSNWTFTSGTPGRAILRMFVIQCAESATAILGTPVVPDEASAAHHDNPDHVVEVFATDADEVARWEAIGIAASVATISQSLVPPHDSLVVETDAGLALQLDLLPAGVPLPQGYQWQAVYSSGVADPLVWFWGDEIAPTTSMTRFQATLGPGSALDGTAVQTNFAQRWGGLDITYEPGLPSE